jgi:hypothetical protein
MVIDTRHAPLHPLSSARRVLERTRRSVERQTTRALTALQRRSMESQDSTDSKSTNGCHVIAVTTTTTITTGLSLRSRHADTQVRFRLPGL